MQDKALFAAIDQGDCEAFRRLLDAGGNPNALDDGETALTWAVYEENIGMVAALLDAGADLDGRAENGETALITAAGIDIEIVRFLLTAGADVDCHSNDGTTALLEAVRTERLVRDRATAAGERRSSECVLHRLRG